VLEGQGGHFSWHSAESVQGSHFSRDNIKGYCKSRSCIEAEGYASLKHGAKAISCSTVAS
jgi:hypothetical protein